MKSKKQTQAKGGRAQQQKPSKKEIQALRKGTKALNKKQQLEEGNFPPLIPNNLNFQKSIEEDEFDELDEAEMEALENGEVDEYDNDIADDDELGDDLDEIDENGEGLDDEDDEELDDEDELDEEGEEGMMMGPPGFIRGEDPDSEDEVDYAEDVRNLGECFW